MRPSNDVVCFITIPLAVKYLRVYIYFSEMWKLHLDLLDSEIARIHYR